MVFLVLGLRARTCLSLISSLFLTAILYSEGIRYSRETGSLDLITMSICLPFLINFVERIDRNKYDQAIACKDMTTSSYDPETQTSISSMPTGTVLTYRDTWFGNVTEQDDT